MISKFLLFAATSRQLVSISINVWKRIQVGKIRKPLLYYVVLTAYSSTFAFTNRKFFSKPQLQYASVINSYMLPLLPIGLCASNRKVYIYQSALHSCCCFQLSSALFTLFDHSRPDVTSHASLRSCDALYWLEYNSSTYKVKIINTFTGYLRYC